MKRETFRKILLFTDARSNYSLLKEQTATNRGACLVLYPADTHEPPVKNTNLAQYIPHCNQGLPLAQIQQFIGNDKTIAYFHIPFDQVALYWIIRMKLAGVSDFFIGRNSLVPYSVSQITYLKIRTAILIRLSRYTAKYNAICPILKYLPWKRNLQATAESNTELSIPDNLKILANQKLTFQSQDIHNLKITNMIGTLGPGGAERQLCNLVCGLKERGFRYADVITYYKTEGADGHYLPRLLKAGIRVSTVDLDDNEKEGISGIELLAPEIQNIVAAIYRHLKKNPPDILHIWLDYTNVTGALAAILAGIPRIILSTRNVSPYHFPRFYHPWYKPYYVFFTECRQISFINNSRRGAEDYAAWMGCEKSLFNVILNGLDFSEISIPSTEACMALRKSLGVQDSYRMVCGIFRLTAEKRPKLFIDIAEKVLKACPNTVFIHAGEDPLESGVKEYAESKGISKNIMFLGRRKDAPLIMASSDAMLLASEFEGTPNVLLEAQYLGCPPVASDAGGVADCIINGTSGFVHEINDTDGMVESLIKVLTNQELHESLKMNAQKLIQERFSLDRMLSETINHYKDITDNIKS